MKPLLILLLILVSSCAHRPVFNQTVPYVDIPRYMGTWYVLAGRFTPFERDVHHAIESYNWNSEREIIEIDFSYYRGSLDGEKIELPQYARIYNQKTNAHWKVSPIGLIQFDFLVLTLASDYSWTAIGTPDQKYLWIMSRKTRHSQEEIQEMIDKVSSTGYPVNELVFVPHP